LITSCSSDKTTGPKKVTQHGTVTTGSYDGHDLIIYKTPGWTGTSPVLYLLHSFGSDYTEMTARYQIDEVADYLYAQGHIKDMAIVMPNLKNDFGGSFYTDVADFEAFITGLENSLNLNPAHRGIAGLGMGGYGAMLIALQQSDLFESVSSHSGFLHFGDVKNLIPAVLAENPRGILFTGKITAPDTVPINENSEYDILFASGDFAVVDNTLLTWGVTHRIENSPGWMNPVFSNNTVIPPDFSNRLQRNQQGSVASNHHQGIERLGKALVVSARSFDSLPEAIEWADFNNRGFLMAVQWHPERMDTLDAYSKPLAEEFLEEAEVFQKEKR